jgi:hypothetical protein
MKVLLAVALGIGFLFIFFRAVQAHWPQSYFGATEGTAFSISSSPHRFLLFRFIPVFISCLFVAVSLERVRDSAWLGALVVGLGHGLLTAGVSLFAWVRLPERVRRGRAAIALLQGLTFFGVIAVAVAAAAARHLLAPLIPPIRELTAALWTALLAGVAGAFVINVSRKPTSEVELVRHSIRRIPRILWEVADEISTGAGADVHLVRAVMVVENLQRPGWFRRLERLKSRILPVGTYGIMQVSSTSLVSDEESIRMAASRMAGVRVTDEDGSIDGTSFDSFARSYNGDSTFRSLLQAAYAEVQYTID